MSKIRSTRRRFLQSAAVMGGSALLASQWPRPVQAAANPKLHIACNHYPWLQFYRRDNKDFNAMLDAGFAEVAQSGCDGFEPMIGSPKQIDEYSALLKKHNLEMRSIYVGATLHKAAEAAKSIANMVAIGERAKLAGTRIIVTNPSPLRGEPQDKTDAELKVQAAALDEVGAKLAAMGLTLAYHNHSMELRNAAREFHHMLLGTDPKHLTFCLDAHWIYRGSGNSTVALVDVVKLYGARVSELHLRQSANNIWTETLGEGDIDYPALAKQLAQLGAKPLLVLEQAPEKGTPKAMDAVQSHRASREYATRVFAEFAT